MGEHARERAWERCEDDFSLDGFSDSRAAVPVCDRLSSAVPCVPLPPSVLSRTAGGGKRGEARPGGGRGGGGAGGGHWRGWCWCKGSKVFPSLTCPSSCALINLSRRRAAVPVQLAVNSGLLWLAHTCMPLSLYLTCPSSCDLINVRTHTHTHTHANAHAHAHTYKHTHTHTHTLSHTHIHTL